MGATGVVRGPVLTTERLTLAPFTVVDVPELHDLFTDADVRRHLLDDMIVSREWVEDEVASSQARFAEAGCGLWAVRERGKTRIVGFVGFRPFHGPPDLQLLYGLLPAYWGRGYATEAARAAVDYAFGVLGLEELRAASDAPNAASIALLHRLGMRERMRTSNGASGEGTVYFALGAEEWAASRAR